MSKQQTIKQLSAAFESGKITQAELIQYLRDNGEFQIQHQSETIGKFQRKREYYNFKSRGKYHGIIIDTTHVGEPTKEKTRLTVLYLEKFIPELNQFKEAIKVPN
jgi:hypothetical protein